MAFNGYLISVGQYSIELEHFIVAQSYHVSKKVIDLNSYRDGDGILRRNALDHIPYSISFDIKRCNNTELQKFLNMIRSNFISTKERKLMLNFYNPENDDYISQEVYMPDPDFVIERIEPENNQIYYKTIQIKFIGY